jgi:hypothetical protein
MWIRESKNFKKIVITSESYNEAFNEMTTEQAIELNDVLKEHMSNWKKYNYNRAFKEYRRKIYRNYIDLLLDGRVTDDEDLWLPDNLNI